MTVRAGSNRSYRLLQELTRKLWDDNDFLGGFISEQTYNGLCSPYGLFFHVESENHRIVWVWRDLKGDLIPISLSYWKSEAAEWKILQLFNMLHDTASYLEMVVSQWTDTISAPSPIQIPCCVAGSAEANTTVKWDCLEDWFLQIYASDGSSVSLQAYWMCLAYPI